MKENVSFDVSTADTHTHTGYWCKCLANALAATGYWTQTSVDSEDLWCDLKCYDIRMIYHRKKEYSYRYLKATIRGRGVWGWSSLDRDSCWGWRRLISCTHTLRTLQLHPSSSAEPHAALEEAGGEPVSSTTRLNTTTSLGFCVKVGYFLSIPVFASSFLQISKPYFWSTSLIRSLWYNQCLFCENRLFPKAFQAQEQVFCLCHDFGWI